ncbi:MAG: CoA-binding protein [Burkholderiales bacterium]|nr:CoA-binding protein [Burkholderiales bacterium]
MTESELADLFSGPRTVAVVGLSADSTRPSYGVAAVMQRAGYRIIPVNPRYVGQVILGEPCIATLADADAPIDIVDCFRRSEDMPEIAIAAAALSPRPRVLWMQIGVQNAVAAQTARDAGLAVVENKCLKIEYLARHGR